jgi:hypothetical protein
MTNINNIEILNILIAVFMLFLILRIKNTVELLVILFLYGSLHFSFGVLPLSANDATEPLRKLHIDGGGVLANASAALLFLLVLLLLYRENFSFYLKPLLNIKSTPAQISLIMFMVGLGYLFNYRPDDWMQLKNVVFIEAMLSFLLVGFIATASGYKDCLVNVYFWAVGGVLLLVIVNTIAFYEIFSHKSWASTQEHSGVIVYRASATLFNPNLLAFWASLSYLLCAYLSVKVNKHKTLMLIGMILASVAIYLSGSRTVAYLLLFSLTFPVLSYKNKLDYKGLLTFPITISLIYALSACLSKFHAFPYELVKLGNRFAVAPLYLLNYIFDKLGFSYRFEVGVPIEVTTSIEGRFNGGLIDSGWLVLHQDIGLIGLLPIILYCVALTKKGIDICRNSAETSHLYIFSLFLISILIGTVMRFQIYPVWLFIGITTIAYLVLLEKSSNSFLIK